MERIAAQKNSEFTGTVESFGSNGEGIVHSGETVFFAPFTVVGEKVKLKALKVKDNIGYAKALEILTPADERVRPRCPSFTKCGGCQLQHIKYGVQLKMKSKTVRDALRKIAGIDYPVPLTVKSEHQFEYRNKMQIPVGRDAQGNDAIGFYAERSHRIVPFEKCPIHPAWSEEVVSIFREYMRQSGVRGYDERTGRGLLRHIVVRDVDGGLIVTAVTNGEEFPQRELLVRMLEKKFSRVTLWQNVNIREGNAVFGSEFRLISGEGKFSAAECGIRYEAGPNTFVQVNQNVCRKLYDRAVQYAKESGAKVAIDCYSGGGLLTAMLAKAVGCAYGIEIVKEASECADSLRSVNKLEGKMHNVCGRVEEVLPSVLQGHDPSETVLVTDPPRKGMDRSTVRCILGSGIRRVIMISCNPATMARDVGLLTGALKEQGGELKKEALPAGGAEGCYRIVGVQPFDMFPQTKNVETLVCLERV